MPNPETIFSNEIRHALEALGAMVFKVHGHGMQESGWPDLQVYHPQWTGHIETKVGDRNCTTGQKLKIRDLRQRNTHAIVVRLSGGRITAEDEDCCELAYISPDSWRFTKGNTRGNALMELFHLACSELEKRAGYHGRP